MSWMKMMDRRKRSLDYKYGHGRKNYPWLGPLAKNAGGVYVGRRSLWQGYINNSSRD